MDILSKLRDTSRFKQLYDVPFKLNGTMPSDLHIALFCNPCYGFGDIIFCLKMYNYIKEWYGIECTLVTTKPKPFIDNGVKKIFLVKVPKKAYVECANIKDMKIYSINEKGEALKRVKPPVQYDLIFVTPWIGTDYEPKHSSMKPLFPYSNRFNTFLFSEYNAPEPHKYDFPTGIGKGLYGLLITEWKITGQKMVDNPYLMVHLTQDDRVNVTACFSKFIKLMCKKYSKQHPNLDVILPAHVLGDKKGIAKLIKHIKDEKYYDVVDIITKKGEYPEHSSSDRILRFRSELTPMPYEKYVSMFNYCLPDVLITGDQSVTDIISCCKDYNIYYQIMPWKRNLAKNLSKVTGAQKDYLRKVRDSCGLQRMSDSKKLNLRRLEDQFDFRKLGKEKLDGIINNARLLTTNKDVKKYVKIVLNSRKKSSVVAKLKEYLKI
jgi:hypothetical protein